MKAVLLLAALLGSAVSFADVRVDSVYTSLFDGCAVINSSDFDEPFEIDYVTKECAGLAGYRPTIQGGDLRYSLSLTYNDTVVFDGNLTAAFNDTGEKAEWRYEVTDRTEIVYTALIYRINYQTYVNESPADTTALVVVRLNGANTCVVGLVSAANDMNQTARDIADDKSAQCIASPSLQ